MRTDRWKISTLRVVLLASIAVSVLLGLHYLGVRADAVWRTTTPTLTEISSLTELTFPPQTSLSGSSRRRVRDTMIARVVMPEMHLPAFLASARMAGVVPISNRLDADRLVANMEKTALQMGLREPPDWWDFHAAAIRWSGTRTATPQRRAHVDVVVTAAGPSSVAVYLRSEI